MLAQKSIVQSDNRPPVSITSRGGGNHGRRGRDQGRPMKFGGFGDFFRHPEQSLAAIHLGPDLFRPDTSADPYHRQIVEQIRAFTNDGIPVVAHDIDHHLNGFFRHFLGGLGRALTQQSGRAGNRRIKTPRRYHRIIEPLNQITHSMTIAELDVGRIKVGRERANKSRRHKKGRRGMPRRPLFPLSLNSRNSAARHRNRHRSSHNRDCRNNRRHNNAAGHNSCHNNRAAGIPRSRCQSAQRPSP